MILVLIFLVNAALSFALSLLLASLLGPDAFGRYAIGLSVTLVINTALFEWLRLSTTRFYSERVREEEPTVRATLDRLYLATGATLTGAVAVALLSGLEFGLSRPLFAAAAGCGLAYGLCEYRMALARALFLERAYAGLGLLRALFGFVLAAGAASVSADPAWVLAGAALSALLPILFVRRTLHDPAGTDARLALAKTFARYALPLVAATALYQILPLLNRTLLASREGFTEAGYFALASELVTRLFQNLGAALDLVLFQLAVRADELHGREAAERQVARNAGAIAAVVIPSAFGLWLVWPAFEALFIPAAFQGRLSGTMMLMIPALAAFALVQYALNPVFQLRRRTAPVVAAALAALGLDLLPSSAGPGWRVPKASRPPQLVSFAGGLLVLGALALIGGARLPWRDIGLALLASGLMSALLWPLRGAGSPILTLSNQIAAGVAIYGAIAIAVDLAGARAFAMGLLRRTPTP